MTDVKQPGRTAPRLSAPAFAALVVSVLAALVAANRIIVTAGGNDQRDFHWKTVQDFGKFLPHIDIVDVHTATAPLYHLTVAVICGPLHLGEVGAEIVGSLFAAALAAVAVWFSGSIRDPAMRALAVAPLLLSPYFWQSALWMLNDAAALLFGLAALIVALRQSPGRAGTQISIGLLLAAAVATRQTMVWAVVPTLLVILLGERGASLPDKVWAAARIMVPPLAVVTVLATLWHGLVPPEFQEINAATRSWVSPSYCAAVVAIFFAPVLAATGVRAVIRPGLSVGVAAAAALPAVVFPSAATVFPDDSRRGGFIWTLVAHTPTLGGRSIVLAALAFGGAFVACQVLGQLDWATAVLTGTSLLSVAAVLCAGGQLYQKYVELPIAGLALIVICALSASGRVRRHWPLAALATLQTLLTVGIVVVPIVSAME